MAQPSPHTPAYSGDPAWSGYTPTQGQAPFGLAATPWTSSAHTETGQGSGSWAAALPQRTTQGVATGPAAAVLPSERQGMAAAAAATQPLLPEAAVAQPAVAQAAVVETLTRYSYFSEHYIVEWQFDEDGWWTSYSRGFSDRLEECYQSTAEVKQFSHTPGRTIQYTYNVDEFWQESGETHRRRMIRRILISAPDYLARGVRAMAIEEHNRQHHNLEACHRRTGRRARSQSAAPSHSRSRSKY